MSDRSNTTTNQAQNNSRENLFYFLRILATQAGPDGAKSRELSPIPNEQIENYIQRNGLVQ
ncbi:hypothetical protein P8935_01230 [Telmatobacter sp. DSM 110680]|uniref:Uncharacterized protein n=1 Tax=Telmatobacter sp. DSM 110680 TaxID=3036704 RepID=A0AAU7DKS2_9BACT